MKRFGAGFGLLAILVGVPAALLRIVGRPRIPSFAGSDGLSGSYVPAEGLIGVLAILAWALCVYLAVAVVINLVAQLASRSELRGRDALLSASASLTPRVVRRLVELAVGGLMVAATVSRGIQFPDTPRPAPATVMVAGSTEAVPVESSSKAEPNWETYRVRPGDSLWRIAERELGSGFRWRRIYELNRGRHFPGGTLTSPRYISPGWVLDLPKRDREHSRGDKETGPASNGNGDHPEGPSPGPATSELEDATPTPKATIVPNPSDAPPDGQESDSDDGPELEDPEPERPRTPVVRLPSGLSVAASFASGLLTAHLLGRLRERRSRRLSGPERPVSPEPPMATDLRRAGASPLAGSLDVALETVAQAWQGIRDRWPQILMAIEGERQVNVFIRDDEGGILPPPSGGSVSPLVRFSRTGPLARAEVGGPFPSLLRPLSTPLQRGLMVPLGHSPEGTAVHAGMIAGGPGATVGSMAADLARQMVVATASRSSPEDLEVILLGVPSELQSLERLPQVTGAYTWEQAAAALQEVQAEFVRRARLFLEEGVEDVWAHLAHHPEERLPAILVVAGQPPPALRGLVEALGQQGPGVGAGLLAVAWQPADPGLIADVSESELRSDLPGAERLQPFLLAQNDAEQAVEIVRRAHPKDEQTGLDGAGLDEPELDEGPELNEPEPEEPEPQEPEPQEPDIDDTPQDAPPEELAEPEAKEEPPPVHIVTELETEPTPIEASAASVEGMPGMVAVRCLGQFEVSREGRPLRKGWRAKSLELVAFLAANPSGASKERIVEELWPEVDPRQGNELFYVVTSGIRRRLRIGDDSNRYVDRDGEIYRLQDGEWWIDAWEFERQVNEAEHPDQPGGILEKLRCAVALYQDEFCAGSYYPWAEPMREHLRALFVHACARLADLLAEEGEQEEALTILNRAVEADPVCEDLCRRAMAIDASLGRRNAALARYRRLETILSKELDVNPDPETQAFARRMEHDNQTQAG